MHGPADLVLELLLVIAVAAMGAALFERMRLPAVVGFLVAGAVVGPGGLGLVDDPERVSVLAEFGVAFLLFEIGLELPLDELRRSFRTSVMAGGLQVAITLVAVAGLAMNLGVPGETAIVMGMLVAMSSTALVMRVLAQQGEVETPHGQLALGILLFQDLCIVPFLLVVPLLAGEVPREMGPVALALGRALAAIALLFAVARFALPWVLAQVARLRSADLFSIFAFLVAMGSAVVAEQAGLTLAVGAFIGGLVLSASPYATQMFAEVAPLRGVLLGIFFTAVGMLLDSSRALALWPGVLFYVGGVVVFKSLVVMAASAVFMRGRPRAAIRAGLSLAQTGEFSFVLAAAAAAAGLLSGDLQQIFVAGSILTLIATPFLIRGSAHLALLVGRVNPVPLASDELEPRSDHVILVGYGLAGRTLARVLAASQIPYCILDTNPHLVEQARSRNEPVVFGDAVRPAVLEHLGIRRARLVSIAINDPQATRETVELCRALAPDVHIVARTSYARDQDQLFRRGASQVVTEELEASLDLASKVLRRFDIPQAAIAHFLEQLRDEGYELLRAPAGVPIDPWLAELLKELSTTWVEVPSDAPAARSILALRVRTRTGASILAIRRREITTANPSPEFEIQPCDELLVLAPGEKLAELRSLLAGEEI